MVLSRWEAKETAVLFSHEEDFVVGWYLTYLKKKKKNGCIKADGFTLQK